MVVVWFGAAHVLLLLARSWPAERAGSVGERRGQRRETRLGEESRPSSCLTSETLRRQIPQLRMHSRRFFNTRLLTGVWKYTGGTAGVLLLSLTTYLSKQNFHL